MTLNTNQSRDRRITEGSIAHFLHLIAETPSRRKKPLGRDLDGEFDFWFDGGACQFHTGYCRYVFSEGTAAEVYGGLSTLSVMFRFADGRCVWVHQEPGINCYGSVLSKYHGRTAILIVFAPYADEDRYRQVLMELEQATKAVSDRNLLVVRVLEWGENWLGDDRLDIDSASALRHRFAIGVNQFVIVLIGADGLIKMRTDSTVSVGEILCRLGSRGRISKIQNRNDDVL